MRNVKTFHANAKHCLALDNEGNAYCWGYSLNGALGFEVDNLEACETKPKKIKTINEKINNVYTGKD
jgi:alpha-tubulin suppressor-like RCC1 family protein